MPYCPHCGASVNSSFSFCPSCGNKLSGCDSDSPVPVFTSMRIESSSLSGMRGFYEGYALDGKPHGKGKVKWDNGDTYDGEWKNGLKEGYGVYQWSNGDRYEGEWDADTMEGQGKQEYMLARWEREAFSFDGVRAIYQGSFANGLWNGEGLLILLNEDGQITSRYASASWKDGVLSGHYRCYLRDNYYLDCTEFDKGIHGRAVDAEGVVCFYYHGRCLLNKNKAGYYYFHDNLWFIIKN